MAFDDTPESSSAFIHGTTIAVLFLNLIAYFFYIKDKRQIAPTS